MSAISRENLSGGDVHTQRVDPGIVIVLKEVQSCNFCIYSGTIDFLDAFLPDMGVVIYSLPPKVGDTLTAIPEGAAAATYQWLADGKEISGATKATLSVTENLLGKKISVTVTAEDGEEATSAETKAVTQDKKAEVTIVDIDGLQSDGTGLVGDRLHLSYGSEMGVPELITWYYNETVSKSERADSGTGLSQMLNLATGAGTLNKDGDYYAVITNKDGATYTSNTITLVYDELPATVASINIEDDYEGNENITYLAKDYTAVLTVNMKKFYDGKFYVYEDGVVNYNSGNYATMLATDDVAFVNATTSDKMTAKNVLDTSFKGLTDSGSETINSDNALKYVAPNGETTLMWAVRQTNGDGKNFLNRGKSYKVVFDQAGIATDNITAASRKDVEATDSVEAPYVVAPASLVLETAANGQNAVAYFVDADGEKLTWLGAANNNSALYFDDEATGFDYVSVYGNGEAKTDGAERATTGGTIVKGVWTSDGAIAKDKTIYYAEAKTIAGIYGEESVKLQSDYKTKNLPLASKVKLADDGTAASITLNDVIAPATVYVYNVLEAAEAGGFDPDDSSSYRGSAKVAVGQGSATVSSVFKKDEVGEVYGAVLVPDDAAAYARKTTTPNADNTDTGDDQLMTLKNKPTTLEYKPAATLTDGGIAAFTPAATTVFTNQFTSTTLVVKNQFGEEITDDTYLNKVKDKAATVAASNSGKKYVEDGGATYSYDGTTLTIDLQSKTNVDSGDGYDVTIMGAKISFRAALEPSANGQTVFTAKLGSDTLCSGGLTVTAGAVTVNDNSELAWALGQSSVTTINLGAAIVTDRDFTVPATQEIVTGTGKELTVSAGDKLTLKGKITTAGAAELVVNGTLDVCDAAAAPNEAHMLTSDGTIVVDDAAAFEAYAEAAFAGASVPTIEIAGDIETTQALTVTAAVINVPENVTLTVAGGALELDGTDVVLQGDGNIDLQDDLVVTEGKVDFDGTITAHDGVEVSAVAADAVLTKAVITIDEDATTGVKFTDTTATTTETVKYAATYTKGTNDYTTATNIANTGANKNAAATATLTVDTGKIQLKLA